MALDLRGLGIHSLKALNDALRTKWLWMSTTSDILPSSAIELMATNGARAIFRASTAVGVGDGSSSLF